MGQLPIRFLICISLALALGLGAGCSHWIELATPPRLPTP